MDSFGEGAFPRQAGQPGGSNRFGTPAPTEPRSILVLGGYFLSADILALALTHARFSARCVAPVTPERLRLALNDWPVGMAVLDVDSVEPQVAHESIVLLGRSNVPVLVFGGKKDLLADCVNLGAAYAIDKALPVSKLIDVTARLFQHHSLNGSATDAQPSSYPSTRTALHGDRPSPFDVLTYREKCVLAELMEGHCAEEIAVRDVVAISTVRSQIKAILQKLGVSSQLAATALARHAGWTFSQQVRP